MPVCKLCGENVTKILQHHYPVPRELEGTEMVPVCYSCHMRDHRLIGKLKDEIESGSIQKDLWGQDPHRERRALLRQAIDETIKRILSRPCLHTIGGFS